MHARTFVHRERQRGYTLMEILVAVAIFATVMIVALLLYDQSNRVFKKTNESAEMQQNTRVAYEKVVADLRMAGFDYKRAGTPSYSVPSTWGGSRDYSIGALVTPTVPNGHVYRCITAGTSGLGEPTWKTATGAKVTDKPPLEWQEAGAPIYEQPDEQIEYVNGAAVTVRANFDYDDPTTTDHGRETALETKSGGRFPLITTGNDEIVTYALVSRSGDANANKDTISFFADVNDEGTPEARRAYPGGSAEREIKITGVDLTNNYPPYTLMRYALDKEGKVVGTALADGIRSMNISYWEDSQATRPLKDILGADATNIGGGGKYDPAKPNDVIAERLVRGKVRAMTLSIVGMNPQIDYSYTHPTDTVAKNYRQYTLQSTVVGRNLGLEGIPASNSNPPGAPVIDTVCYGYCGVAAVLWSPAPGTIDTTYTVLYDTDPNGSYSNKLPAGTQTSYFVDLTQLDLTQKYYFKVAATNAAGTTLSVDWMAVDVKNATKPKAPVIATVSGGGQAGDPSARANEVELVWTAPTANETGAPTCAPSGTPPAAAVSGETQGYRIWRSKTSGFKPGDPGSVQVLDENTPGASTDGSGTWRFIDTTAATCETYYYVIQAVEWCAAKGTYNTTTDPATGLSAFSTERPGRATLTDKPKAPQNLRADPTNNCNSSVNQCDPVILHWDPVTQDEKDVPIVVDRYRVYRQARVNGVIDGTNTLAGTITDASTLPSPMTFKEPSPLAMYKGGDTTKVLTYDYTVIAAGCLDSNPSLPLSLPNTCSTGATVVPDATSTGSGTKLDPFVDVESLTVVPHPAKAIKGVKVSIDGGASTPLNTTPFILDWTDNADGAVHTVAFSITTDNCTETIVVYVQNDAPPCAVKATVTNIASNLQLQLDLTNIDTEDVTFDTFDITWAGQSGFDWSSISIGGNVFTATGAPTAARTVTFTPLTAADKKLAQGATKSIIMQFALNGASTGSGYAFAGNVTSVVVRYKKTSTGNTLLTCTPALSACRVTSTTTGATSTLSIAMVNNSTDELDVSKLTIAWAGQSKWQWDSITLPDGTNIKVGTATSSGTEVFSTSNQKVSAGGTYIITMNMSTTQGGAGTLDPAKVGTVSVRYTTPPSGNSVLDCRAQ